ncbi:MULTISPECIES: chromosome segregation protein SMC [Aminobacterium]|uniref:chromosome segregation protein SMC n=1 Tax=Aminobacterium TaxID=81466 RepID=UPI00257E8B44|nr:MULTISPECIES: chromosome segregation protein SMC [unclassified Aminobacterium]
MFIERLRLKGFKSFGGEHELLFSPGFTAIVGPNGSGKSNILDGLRWVLGEGSPNRLRITKQSDLLFQGSASVPSAGETEVLLSLREDPQICTVRREFSPESGTTLSVDGVRIRLQDLDEIKREWHLEGEQFAFIGQGEVAEAIRQRPLQRRTVLEALFGIDRYRKKREDASQKLKSATDELARLQTLVLELTMRRDEILPLVSIAEEARGILHELEGRRRDYYFSRRTFLEKEIVSLQHHVSSVDSRKAQAIEWETLWEYGLRFYQSKIAGLKQNSRSLGETLIALDSQRDSLHRQCFAVGLSVKGAREKLCSLAEDTKILEGNLKEVRGETAVTKKAYVSFCNELKEKEGVISSISEEFFQLRTSLHEERKRRQKCREEVARLEMEKNRIDARLKARKAALEGSLRERDEAEKKLQELMKDSEHKQHELLDLQAQREGTSALHAEAYASCQQLASSVTFAKKNVTQLENQLETLYENTEQRLYPEPVRVVLAAGKLGKLNIKATLVADAFTCSSELASPLEAYLGGRQFWLLVSTLEEAREGIELVKERKAGRVTFLPLERCYPRTPDRNFHLSDKGIVGWAVDLLSIKEPWDPAVRHLLGDLLIIESYDVGVQLARIGASFPIVTLDGDVFTVAGSVSGGKFRRSGGAIERRLLIDELNNHLEKERLALKNFSSELREAEKREQEVAFHKTGLCEQEQEIEKELSILIARKDSLFKEAQRLKREEDAFKKEAEQDVTLTEQIILHSEELEKTILDFGDLPDEADLEHKLSSAQAEAAITREKVRAHHVLVERMDSEVRRMERTLLDLTQEREKVSGDLLVNLDRLQSLGKESYHVWSRRGNALKEEKRVQDDLVVINNKITFLVQRHADAVQFRQNCEEQLRDCRRQLDNVEGELTQITSLWEENYPYPGPLSLPDDLRDEGLAGVKRLEKKLRELGEYDLGVLSEHESLNARLAFLSEQMKDVRAGIKELQEMIQDTDRRVGQVFGEALVNTDKRFNALFQRLFGGGEAHLQMEEGLSLWEAGVDIYARPPGKKLQNLTQLSGGEQSLSAIALLFATMEVAAVPLAILDEVDAALDEYNLLRFVDLVTDYAAYIQILAMTHRRSTMERADVLYGVTMSEPGLSKVIGVSLDEWKE